MTADTNSENIHAALAATATQHGQTLAEVTDRAPTLLVFLRHLG